MLGTLWGMNTRVQKYKRDNAILYNNENAYKKEISILGDSLTHLAGVYKFTIEDLYTSRDSIIKELESTRKKLKIKDSQIENLLHLNSTLKTDTVVEIEYRDSCQFDLSIAYNPMTIFDVSVHRKDGTNYLNHKAYIEDSYKIFTYNRQVWKEPVWYKRLFLFRWGKLTLSESTLHHDNDMIDVKDVKVITINK